MRMRKLPWAEDYLQNAAVVVRHPEKYAGNWRQFLHTDIIHLEIGSGKGDYWVQMGKMYPDIGWIGVEKNTNVAAIAVRKYDQEEEHCAHTAFIHQDAEALDHWFGEHEVDVIHLNFSDPWPKKRTHKRRLSNKRFIQQYKKILKPQGEIQMKTDNADLFEYSILQFQNAGWFLHMFSVDYRREEHPEDAVSEYEQRFIGLKQPIYRAVWKQMVPEK
ncbi:MAG: tRNA (guanosine(46)-N7)-methyltransferase TrmB [Erysipelotrichaceae bacterium]|jgi:tRNA (guanine-N7-)-methyltransferase|nr:tRNA (guanosine(46)-N7)-methyltransferase TrmB [Erysipelotrichaceae bacterium]